MIGVILIHRGYHSRVEKRTPTQPRGRARRLNSFYSFLNSLLMIYQQNGNTCWTSKTADSLWTSKTWDSMWMPLSAFPVSCWFSHGAHFVIKKLSNLWKRSFAKIWCHQKKHGTILCWNHEQPQNSVEQMGVPWEWKITWGTLLTLLCCPSTPWHTAW